METISSREMGIVDENCVFLGLPRSLLMENAGRAVAEELARRLGGARGRKIVVVAGLGDNGGDGLVAARHLASMGAEVHVILLGREGAI
ncbi:bifunctional ADP-dependent NAD(P)H-hydrate dehydratase/NAD(P)H-hydrate epimerase, partial [Candidatus Bathyarchaeota archaeon]